MMKPYVYAELLLNIRQISVLISLPSESKQSTTVVISAGGESISLVHAGYAIELKLPGQASTSTRPILTPVGRKELSFRLPVSSSRGNFESRDSSFTDGSCWSASSLTSFTRVACRSCKCLIVREGAVVWKDLPNSNWAEMMDFWHCHKPDTESSRGDDANAISKGYGASASLKPTAGVGLVDSLYFHLVKDACNVQMEANDLGIKVGPFQY